MLVYLFLDWIVCLFPFKNFNITPWNPLAGFGPFVVFRWGSPYLVVLYLARVLGDLVLRKGAGSPPVILVGALVVVGSYWLTARVLRGAMRLDAEAPTLKEVSTLIVAALLVTAPTALAYVLLLSGLGALSPESLLEGGLRRYVGDVIGIITVLPAVLTLAQRVARPGWQLVRPSWRNVLQASAVLGVVVILFGITAIDEYKFFYVLFLPVIWIAVEGGFSAAAFGVLWAQVALIMVISVLGGYSGTGVTEIQILMTTLAVTGLMLGTVVSERHTAEARLVEKQVELSRAERRAASGELASVIAHELNQPLTAIINYARASQLIQQRHGDPALLDETLSKTVVQANRAGEIVRRLRNFIGRGDNSPVAFAINDLVAEVIKLNTPSLRSEGIAIRTELSTDLDPVFADRVQIFQVLDNLFRNAIDAMVANRSRVRILAVRTARDPHGDICVRVADSGPGIGPDLADRIFLPFVTSKDLGMGLGLAICRTIVTAHEGRLWYEPAENGGAAFNFTLAAYLDDHDYDS